MLRRSPDTLTMSDNNESRREQAHLQVLQLLKQDPELSQRELADRLGISLGKAHYLLQGLAEKGFIKVQNFSRSQKKLRYLYQLTPAGLEHKARITMRYLQRRLDEYELIRAEILSLADSLDLPPDTVRGKLDGSASSPTPSNKNPT
jgi:EPS-associated MarR family transcriptional regulator